MRLGTDIIEIERIKEARERQENFARKILADDEYALYQEMSEHRQNEFLAGRFSCKEAYVKALGTGIGKIKFSDISILNNVKGAPFINDGPIVDGVVVSISHSKHYATATVIIDLPEIVIKSQIKEFLA